MASAIYAAFWGKARPANHTSPPVHPAVFHMLDVAAVAEVLSDICLPADKFDEACKRLVVFMAAIHDLGKISRTFQAVAPDHWPKVLGPLVEPPPDDHHSTLGYRIALDRRVAAVLRGKGGVFERWSPISVMAVLRATMGHHGTPPEDRGQPQPLARTTFCAACADAARGMLAEFDRLLQPARLSAPPAGAEAAVWSWHVAGIVSLADWIGSSQEWFPYTAPEQVDGVDGYLELARSRAAEAVRKAGVVPALSASRTTITGLFPQITDPTAVQRWADAVDLPDGPFLAFIEDMTGNGKSEAAVTLAHRVIAAGRAQGAYFALPTMATANAMYERFSKGGSYRRLFADTADPSLVLTHGKRDLHDGFRASILRTDSDTRDLEARRSRAGIPEWIADDKRTAFFADIGVGSIDQALMAALPTRHAPMRQLGLSRRVLIVDEAHAYDSFMRTELDALLRFQAALGGSAIVLSATLPVSVRQRLADAFRAGLSLPAVPLSQTGYPLTTMVARAGVAEQAHARTAREVANTSARSVVTERVVGREHALREIVAAASAGGAVAWVRNTVDDACDAVDLLRQRGFEPILLHSRFTAGDRRAIEDRVLATFGRTGTGRAGQIIVGTQVIEQSLDIDFDLIVSDLAPVDALIQRAGRLWRHRRGGRPVARARFLLLCPDPVDDPPADWVSSLLPGTAGVYRDPAVLWRSARCLLAGGGMDTPEEVRRLVAEVYSPDAPVPDAMRDLVDKARNKDQQGENAAAYISLDPKAGYKLGMGQWVDDTVITTRLISQPQATIRLVRLDGRGAIVPWNAGPGGVRHAWALSEVSLSAKHISGLIPNPRFAGALAEAQERLARYERAIPIIVLESGRSLHEATLNRDGGRSPITFTYDAQTQGLRWQEG